jgi:hypothetical protein
MVWRSSPRQLRGLQIQEKSISLLQFNSTELMRLIEWPMSLVRNPNAAILCTECAGEGGSDA